jgi:hypothetical protein
MALQCLITKFKDKTKAKLESPLACTTSYLANINKFSALLLLKFQKIKTYSSSSYEPPPIPDLSSFPKENPYLFHFSGPIAGNEFEKVVVIYFKVFFIKKYIIIIFFIFKKIIYKISALK